MAGLGSGLVHGLTVGLTGYQQGKDEQLKQLLVLAAQRRQEERQKQQDELSRLSTLGQLASQGFDVGEPQVAVTDTASRRAVNNQNPTSPEAGAANPQPAEPSQDGTVIGQVGSKTIRVPPGGLVGKAARDDAQKQAQRVTDRYNQLSAAQESITDPKLKKSPAQLRAIAANDVLYNKYTEQATGLATDPLEQHKQMRLFDVAHPTRDVSGDNTSWQTVTTADGSMVQVNPKTGATRPIGLQGKAGGAGGQGGMTAAMRGKAAEMAASVGTIDEALDRLKQHPQAVGILSHGRGVNDVLDQTLDAEGVGARAALASVSSNLLHALSGAAISPSEYARLRQYVPNSRDSYEAARTKLERLKVEMQRSQAAMSGSVTSATPDGTVRTPSNPPRSVTTAPLTPTGGLSDADLWEQYVKQGKTPDQATKLVKSRRRQ